MINPVSRTRRVYDYTDRRVPAGIYDEKIKKKKFFAKDESAPEGILLGAYFRLTSRRWTFNKAAGVSAGARPWFTRIRHKQIGPAALPCITGFY